MWCIPHLNDEYIERMMDVLEVLERPYDPKNPVVCFDEKSKQLLQSNRPTKKTQPGQYRRRDYEYQRNGTVNLFVSAEPKGKRRNVKVTKHRRKTDFARAIRDVVMKDYAEADVVIMIMDNLNTHTEKSIRETYSQNEAEEILSRIEWHFTPKHASWLNPAEIEIGVLSRQCLKQMIPTFQDMQKQVAAWKRRRNDKQANIHWQFTRQKAQNKFKLCYTKELMR